MKGSHKDVISTLMAIVAASQYNHPLFAKGSATINGRVFAKPNQRKRRLNDRRTGVHTKRGNKPREF